MGLAVVSTTAPSPHRHIDVREVIGELRHLHPRAGEGRLSELLAERLEEDRHLLLDASRILVHQIGASIAAAERLRRAAPTPRQRASRKAAEQAQVRAAVTKVKEAVLLDLVMPNGIAMRYCSGTQMAGFGAAYEKIAAKVGDAMVGEVMVESEVKALLQAAV
jgi:hypothetical protein